MEELTRAVWNFMYVAYNHGVLDEVLSLVGMLQDPETDLGAQIAEFEDALSTADFGPFDRMSKDILAPLLQALADEQAMDGLRALVTAAKKVFQRGMSGSSDAKEMIAFMSDIMHGVKGLKPVAQAAFPVVVKVCAPLVKRYLEQHAGDIAARAVNIISRAVSTNPEEATRFIDRLFEGIDGYALRRAMDSLVEAFLDKKPTIARWTTATLVKRARKRIQNRKRMRHG